MHEDVQPIVLVGGRSRRFGSDKLSAPVSEGSQSWIIDRPVAALRAVFGPRVAAVGECAEEVAARLDRVIPDRYPGAGPIGGVLSALLHAQAEVFVLAGDLPNICAQDIRSILAAATRAPDAAAVLAETDTLEPCIGLYRPRAIAHLKTAIAPGASHQLRTALPAEQIARVRMRTDHAANVNTREDLRAALAIGEGQRSGP